MALSSFRRRMLGYRGPGESGYGYGQLDLDNTDAPDADEKCLSFQLITPDGAKYYLDDLIDVYYPLEGIGAAYFAVTPDKSAHLILCSKPGSHYIQEHDIGIRKRREDYVDGSKGTERYLVSVDPLEEQFSAFKASHSADLYFYSFKSFNGYSNVIKEMVVETNVDSLPFGTFGKNMIANGYNLEASFKFNDKKIDYIFPNFRLPTGYGDFVAELRKKAEE